MQDRGLAEARLVRGFVIKTIAKVVGVAIAVFVLTRIWGPNLINRHQDLALAAAVGCYLGALAAIGWLIARIAADRKQLALAKSQLRGAQP